jgi:hypothetical protein
VLAKHSKNFNLVHSLEIGVSDMQRNFEPVTKQVACWRESQLSDVSAKLVIYQAFIEGDIDLPNNLACPVHQLYFNPEHEEFAPRTMWSLSNAFTSALKQRTRFRNSGPPQSSGRSWSRTHSSHKERRCR